MVAGLLAARCSDPDESIRRASLQQLTSLRIPSLADVMMPPVEKLLEDVSPAVRSAAALAVLKVASLVDADTDLQRFWDKVCFLTARLLRSHALVCCSFLLRRSRTHRRVV